MAFIFDVKTWSASDPVTNSRVERMHTDDGAISAAVYKFSQNELKLRIFTQYRTRRVKFFNRKLEKSETQSYPYVTYISEADLRLQLAPYAFKRKAPFSAEEFENLKSIISEGIFVLETKGGLSPSLLEYIPDYKVSFVENSKLIPRLQLPVTGDSD